MKVVFELLSKNIYFPFPGGLLAYMKQGVLWYLAEQVNHLLLMTTLCAGRPITYVSSNLVIQITLGKLEFLFRVVFSHKSL